MSEIRPCDGVGVAVHTITILVLPESVAVRRETSGTVNTRVPRRRHPGVRGECDDKQQRRQ